MSTRRVHFVCCSHLELTGENVSVPLRMIEIFTDPQTFATVSGSTDNVYAIVQHLVRNGK